MNTTNETIDSDKEILLIDNDIEINKNIVMRINYSININNYNVEYILSSINKSISKLENNETFILLLDLKKVKNQNMNISKLKLLINGIPETWSEKLYRCIIYNYTDFWKFLIKMLLKVIDKKNKDKIVFKKELDI